MRFMIFVFLAISSSTIVWWKYLVPSTALAHLSDLTNGWLNPALSGMIILLLIRVYVLIILFGKLRLSDVGLERRTILSGLMLIIGVWIAYLGCSALSLYLWGITPSLFTTFEWQYQTKSFGVIMLASLGEEIIFRGFFLSQIVSLLISRDPNYPGWSLMYALVFSSLIFVFVHLPSRLMTAPTFNDAVPGLIVMLLVSIFLGIVYFITNNLYFTWGVHFLIDIPITIWNRQIVSGGLLIIVIAAIVLIASLVLPNLRRFLSPPVSDSGRS